MLTRIFSTSSRVVAQRIPGIPRANPFQATGYRYKSDVKNEDAVKDVNEVDQLGPCPGMCEAMRFISFIMYVYILIMNLFVLFPTTDR